MATAIRAPVTMLNQAMTDALPSPCTPSEGCVRTSRVTLGPRSPELRQQFATTPEARVQADRQM